MAISSIHPDDWNAIYAVQQNAYTDIEPETIDVLKSKWELTPETCFVSHCEKGHIQAYVLAHRWAGNKPPKLFKPVEKNAALQQADGLYLHDMAVHERAKGQRVGQKLVKAVLAQARSLGVKRISLVAVQGADTFWQKQGFTPCKDTEICASYGDDAVFMQLELQAEN